MYNAHYHLGADIQTQKEAFNYCRTNYREVLKIQIYLSDILNIPISYTDSISISELEYLLKVSSEYMKEKEEAQNRPV